MTKVLILTYYWPPSGGAGVQRWLKFVKYMRIHNWEPVVYTAENGEMPVLDESLQKDVPEGTTVLKTRIWEPYSMYKRFIGRKKEDRINASFLNEGKKTGLAEKMSVWIRGNFFIPDARVFWIRPSIRYLQQFIREHNIQYLISSGPPHSMHLIALGLKKKFPHLKWVADFRDPWTNIDFYEKLMLTPMADKKHHRQELSVLLHADRVLSIGSFMSEEFRNIYQKGGGADQNKFEVITNGYDEEDAPHEKIAKDTKFSVAHVGTLVKDRNPDSLWRALKELVTENSDFAASLEIKLVGKVDVFVKEQIENYGLSPYVKKIDYLPHDAVIVEQQRSRVLLLLVNNTKNAKGILTGKFFEYMASGTPILAIGPVDGELADILHETKTGYISGFDDVQGLKKNILLLHGQTAPERDRSAVAKYSRKALTGKLCEVLEGMK